ncbi:hypothetical protein ACIOWF_06650 [Cellulosimicrobium cellulans]|uniref:hypothetical protein n=1 Tax=Cellulosimicrobium cellulans TaxID=1710 RepID=UPI0037F75A7C
MKRAWGIVAVVSAGLVLAGCSGGEPDEAPAASSSTTEEAKDPATEESPVGSEAEVGEDLEVPEGPWSPGAFQAYAPSGGALMIEIPAAEAPADIEAAREAVGAPPVVYIAVDVDNREGQQSVNMYEVNLYDPDGNEYKFVRAHNAIDEWFYDVGTDTNEQIDLYNLGVETSNAHRDDVAVSQRATLLLVGEEVPDQIADVQVYAEGAFEPSFAVPATS